MLKRVNLAFGEYLDQRGYLDEAGSAYIQATNYEKAQECFLKTFNVEMVLTMAKLRGLDLSQVRADLIEVLKNNARYEQAGDLLDASTDPSDVLDCYLRSNAYDKAIRLCLERAPSLTPSIAQSLQLSFELKFNQLKQVLDTFCTRLLRLKIVQNQKRLLPQSKQGPNCNFELDSENLSVSQQSDSQRSRGSSQQFSETSKKSKRQKNQAMNKMKKKK